MGARVRLIPPNERVAAAPTAGMIREQAVATDRLWAGIARTAPGMISGWHHHGDYETSIYVLSGALHMEFGQSGSETLDARAGDFMYVAPGAVHRESNPSDQESQIVVVRSGSGAPVINVDAPERTAS